MQTARIFNNGNSQAVRLPKNFRFNEDEVVIKKLGDMVILLPTKYNAETTHKNMNSNYINYIPLSF